MSQKGSRTERELMGLFASRNWAVVRSADSGKSPYTAPDLVVGKGGRTLAIECKSSKAKTIYIEPGQVEQLNEFAEVFGAEPYLAARFNNQDWRFLKPSQLKKSGLRYRIGRLEAEARGLALGAVA